MRSAVHCLGLTLLVSGFAGLICMAAMAMQTLENALKFRTVSVQLRMADQSEALSSVASGVNRSSRISRAPFVLLP